MSLYKAGRLLAGSKNFNKEIYLLSDFQKDRFLDNSVSRDTSFIFDNNIKLYTFNLSGKPVSNLSISELKINNQIFELNKNISFSIMLKNSSDSRVTGNILSLFINGIRTAQQSIDMEPNTSKRFTMETTLIDTGLLEVFAEHEGDEIPQDDKRMIDLYVPEKINILILTDVPGDEKFIRIALTGGTPSRNFDVTVQKNQNIITSVLNNYDVIFLLGSVYLNNYQVLKEYISNGGKIIFMPSSVNTLAKFNEFAGVLNLPAAGALINIRSGDFATFDFIDFNHPLFSDLFGKESKKQIDSPEFFKYLKITTGGLGKNIISLVDNSSFLSEYKLGSGTVLMFNAAPEVTWSDFPLKGIFSPLINKCVYYLTGKIEERNNYYAGDEILFKVGGKFSNRLKIVNPKGVEEYLNVDSVKDRKYLRYSNTSIIGSYKMYAGNNLADYNVVSTNPLESNTNYLAENEIDEYLRRINFEGSHIHIARSDNLSEKISSARFGSELWKLCLLLAFLLALVEMLVARSTKKDVVEIKNI